MPDYLQSNYLPQLPDNSPLKYGNKDKEEKYDISSLNVNRYTTYIVRHFGYMKNSVGDNLPDESTNRFQAYSIRTFQRLNVQNIVKGNQTQNKFQTLGMGVQVLHDPTL